MTKKQFLSELERRLNILNDEEKQDIINEYKDIIEEKVRNGKTVAEAIEDFGDIDELTNEILKAYKINPNYDKKNNNETNGSDVLKGLEAGIRKVAQKLAAATKQIIEEIKNSNNDNLTMEKVFEILIKFFILMVVLMFLKIPFHILYDTGVVILDFGHNPIGRFIFFTWKMIVWSIYFVSCLALGYVFFQTQLKKLNDEQPTKKEKVKKIKNQDKPEEVSNDNINVKKNEIKHTHNITYIFRMLVGVIILLPLLFINICLYLTLAVVIYLLIKGVGIYGILIIIIGLIVIFTNIYHAFSNFIHYKKKTYLFPLIIGMMFITVGSLFTFDYISSIKYYDKLPEIGYSKKTMTYKEHINDDKIVINYSDDVKLLVDNELRDNEVVIDVSYYDEYVSINKDIYRDSNKETTYIDFHIHDHVHFRKVINDIIEQLKNREIYQYQSLFDIDIVVYVNEKTMNKIKKD